MSLTDEQDQELTELLQLLEPHLKSMPSRTRIFVQDQITRHQEYGASIFMSPRQWKWLHDLKNEFTNGSSEPELDFGEDD